MKISIHRKFTKNFNSFGFRIGIMVDVENEIPMEAYRTTSKVVGQMTKEEELLCKNALSDYVSNQQNTLGNQSNVMVKQCEKCGAETYNKSYKFCLKCYYDNK